MCDYGFYLDIQLALQIYVRGLNWSLDCFYGSLEKVVVTKAVAKGKTSKYSTSSLATTSYCSHEETF